MIGQAGLFDDAPEAMPDVDLATALRKLETAEGCLSAYEKSALRRPLHDECTDHFRKEVARWQATVRRLSP